MSRILSRISMFTGQISSHALQDVQAHTSSEVMRSNRLLADTVISGSTPMGGETTGVPVRAMTSPDFSTISRGSSDLPVAWAGNTEEIGRESWRERGWQYVMIPVGAGSIKQKTIRNNKR